MMIFKVDYLGVKKVTYFFLFGAVCLLFLSSIGVSTVKAQPGATFDRMWVDYNVKDANQDGMKLHIKLTVNGLKSVDCQIRIVFYYDEENPVKDNNQRFYTTKGHVAVFRDLKPGYDPAVYEDLTVFMPYDELDLSPGDYNLKMDVDAIYKDGELIKHLTWYDFTYSKKAPAKSEPSVVFDRMWVDFNVKEANQDGMKLHIKFTVNGLKSVDCQIRIVFYYDDENPLKDNNQRFYTTKGYVAVFRDLKPGYDTTVYEDLTLFMPYDELELSHGDYNLKMDVDAIYKDGELIKHLNWYDFTYSKKAPAD